MGKQGRPSQTVTPLPSLLFFCGLSLALFRRSWDNFAFWRLLRGVPKILLTYRVLKSHRPPVFRFNLLNLVSRGYFCSPLRDSCQSIGIISDPCAFFLYIQFDSSFLHRAGCIQEWNKWGWTITPVFWSFFLRGCVWQCES